MIERKCPHCGAPIPFRTSICLLAVCARCSSLVRRKDLDVEKLGEVAQLQPDGTPLRLGARGAHQGDAFEVVGRVQLSTGSSCWNEWSIVFAGGKQGWLGEAQGTYAVSFQAEAPGTLPGFDALKLGQKLELGGQTFRVRDLLKARYLSAEGELPFRPPLGEEAPSADPLGLRVTLKRDVMLPRLPFIAFCLLLPPLLWAWTRRAVFENERWMESDHPRVCESDDDREDDE